MKERTRLIKEAPVNLQSKENKVKFVCGIYTALTLTKIKTKLHLAEKKRLFPT